MHFMHEDEVLLGLLVGILLTKLKTVSCQTSDGADLLLFPPSHLCLFISGGPELRVRSDLSNIKLKPV